MQDSVIGNIIEGIPGTKLRHDGRLTWDAEKTSRNIDPLSSSVEGYEMIPHATGLAATSKAAGNWTALSTGGNLLAGVLALDLLGGVGGLAGQYCEVMINMITVHPIDDVGEVVMQFAGDDDSAGGCTGMVGAVRLVYVNDVTNSKYFGKTHISFPYPGYRFKVVTEGSEPRLNIAGGLGAEYVLVMFHYRFCDY
jgi:hypothetical protein